MPQNVTDVDAFTDPITAPAGADVRDSASVLQIAQKLANRTRWLANMLGGVLGTGEWTYKGGARTRKILVPMWSGIGDYDSNSWLKAADPTAAYSWGKKDVATTTRLVFPINALLRDLMTIESIKMLCTPGSGRVAGNMAIGLYYSNPNHETPGVPTVTTVGSPASSSGTSIQVVTFNGGSHQVSREGASGRDYFILITGTDATTLTGGGGLDLVYGVELTLTDPGPRNH